MGELCQSLQLIDGNGEFNVAGLEEFVKAVKLNQFDLSYAVVGIMGPQSSGKSTLLNHLFHTNFKEMDADQGRSQTTKGIWIANCVGIEPLTIVLDLEGTDGRERGEDDTSFEKQSALFALAISDIVLINMWCHDIGREHAANKPLLRTIFQVMTRLFSPRKKTLLFVIRDKTKTPLERLEAVLKKDIQKIWDTVSKPKALKNTPLSEFFNVEVIALSSYEDKEEQFKEQVAQLRKRFFNSTSSGGLAGDRRGVVPASAFRLSAQKIWEVIRENKDLNIPAHKVMVATIRCEEIANEKLSSLARDQDLMALKAAVQAGPVSEFGKKISSILEAYLSEYDKETLYFDENIRDAKRLQLKEKSLNFIHPQYLIMLRHLRTIALENFKTHLKQSLDRGQGFATSVRSYAQSCMVEFDYGCADASVKQAEWDDDSKVRKKLQGDIVAHSSSVRGIKLSEIAVNYENKLTGSLTEPVASLFESGGNDQWASIRELLRRETEAAISGFSTALAKFELDEETFNKMVQNLKDYATTVVEKKAREEAGKILGRMKDRFSKVFYHDNDSKRRVWTGRDQIQTMGKEACSASLKLLSVMAAIRLNEEPDTIENTLFSCLMGRTPDSLASSTWEKVPPSKTLITPVQCKSLWKQFVEYAVDMINSEVKNYEPDDESWSPWLIAAAVVGVAATGYLLGFEIGAMLLLG